MCLSELCRNDALRTSLPKIAGTDEGTCANNTLQRGTALKAAVETAIAYVIAALYNTAHDTTCCCCLLSSAGG